jgi:uncharacterized protein
MASSEADTKQRKRFPMLMFDILKFGVLAYGGLLLLVFFFQTWFIFPATRGINRDPSHYRWPFEEIMLPVAGEKTMGWYIPREDARGVVLFSHGNAGNIADRLESIALLRDMGFSVLAYDYGGYGKSTGHISEDRMRGDIRAMWHWLTAEKGVPPEEIVLFGRSMGGAATAMLAEEVMPGAVILESTFTSLPDIGREKFPWLPMRLVLRYRLATIDRIEKFSAPLLIVHSADDTLIPFHHGRALYERAREPKAFLQIAGDHNEGFFRSERIYRQGWENFLKPYFPIAEQLSSGTDQ